MQITYSGLDNNTYKEYYLIAVFNIVHYLSLHIYESVQLIASATEFQ
jgi:hypothetical protein